MSDVLPQTSMSDLTCSLTNRASCSARLCFHIFRTQTKSVSVIHCPAFSLGCRSRLSYSCHVWLLKGRAGLWINFAALALCDKMSSKARRARIIVLERFSGSLQLHLFTHLRHLMWTWWHHRRKMARFFSEMMGQFQSLCWLGISDFGQERQSMLYG